jgi:hypothetical protein
MPMITGWYNAYHRQCWHPGARTKGGDHGIRPVRQWCGAAVPSAIAGRDGRACIDEIVQQLEALRSAGVGYVLLNGGGSGGGARGRESLRRFARDVMPLFTEAVAQRAVG